MKKTLSLLLSVIMLFSITAAIDLSAIAGTTAISGGSSKANAVNLSSGVEYGIVLNGEETHWFKFTTKSTDDYWYNITVKNVTIGNQNGHAGISGTICDSFEETLAFAAAGYNGVDTDGGKLEANKVYYVKIWGYKEGTLKFQLDCEFDSYSETRDQACELVMGQTYTSKIDSPDGTSEDRAEDGLSGDVDYFKFNSGNMKKVEITLKNVDVGYYNTYFEGVVAKVMDDFNQVYAYVEVRPESEESYAFEVEKNTNYYVKLFASSDCSGTYSFKVECVHTILTSVVEPTYTQAGSITDYCENCGYTFTYSIPKLEANNTWVLDNIGWYFVDVYGNKVTNSWMLDSIGWCYLGADGYMVTNSWIMDSVGWCYVGADGYCVTNCWMKDSIGWCYLDANGRMATNQWIMDSQGWCYVGADGYCVTISWVRDSHGWCFLDAEGRMEKECWVRDSHGWCFLDENGYWDGKYYTF